MASISSIKMMYVLPWGLLERSRTRCPDSDDHLETRFRSAKNGTPAAGNARASRVVPVRQSRQHTPRCISASAEFRVAPVGSGRAPFTSSMPATSSNGRGAVSCRCPAFERRCWQCRPGTSARRIMNRQATNSTSREPDEELPPQRRALRSDSAAPTPFVSISRSRSSCRTRALGSNSVDLFRRVLWASGARTLLRSGRA